MRALQLNADAVVYTKNQPEYNALPALRLDGRILVCWSLTLRERLKLLFSGKLYHQILTFNAPLQPILLTVELPEEFRRAGWD